MNEKYNLNMLILVIIYFFILTLCYYGDKITRSDKLITIIKYTGTTKTGEKCFDPSDIQTKLDSERYFFSYSIVNSCIDH